MDWRLTTRNLGVIVVDIQEKLLPVMHDQARVVDRSRRLLASAKALDIPVWATEQLPQKLGGTVAEIRSAWAESTVVLPKITFSSEPVLPKELPKHLLICGIEAHVCVRQTVYDLRLRGHHIILLGDAISSRSPLDASLAIEEMRADDVLVVSVEAVIWELLRSPEHPKFREVLAILK
jgi:nicotinamidase-related amidase